MSCSCGDGSLSITPFDGSWHNPDGQKVLLMKLDVNAVRVAAELEKEACPNPFVNELQQAKILWRCKVLMMLRH